MRRDAWDPTFDRARPAFAVLARAMAPFREHVAFPSIDAWNDALPPMVSAGGAPIRFVAQPPKRPDTLPYDERIYTRGEVASRRESWHDFFNMLVWVTFPATKRVINARQRAALHARGDLPKHRRLPEQDALAMLDEGGAIVACRDAAALESAVARADVEAIAAEVRDGGARVWIFGHAIYEHLVTGSGVVRALAQVVSCATLDAETADRALADALEKTSVRYDKTALALPVVDTLFP